MPSAMEILSRSWIASEKNRSPPPHKFGNFVFAQGFNPIASMDGDVFSDTAGCLFNLDAIPFFFGPDERLHPVNPRATQFNGAALILNGGGPTAKRIIGFDNDSAKSTLLQVASSVIPASPSITTTSHVLLMSQAKSMTRIKSWYLSKDISAPKNPFDSDHSALD